MYNLGFEPLWADFILEFILDEVFNGLSNNLIDGGQPRAKPYLCKVKLNHILKTMFLALGWRPSIKLLVNPRANIIVPHLK